MKRVIISAVIATAGVAAAASASAGDETGAWYISPMVQYDYLDHERHADDDVAGQLGVGYDFAPQWAAEINGSTGNFSRPHAGDRVKLSAYALDVMLKFFPESILHPYVLAGAGAIDDQLSDYKGTSKLMAEAGLGLLTGIGDQTGSIRVQLRTEAKYRREFVNETLYDAHNPGDVILGVGLNFMFGAPVPPPPPKVAEVVPPPPPLPPPPPPPPPADSDHDGVPDTIDQCPNTPPGDKVDSVGCTIKDEIKLHGVNFATDSADLVPESTVVLDYGVATLNKYPQMVIEVRGHTDNRGSAKHNLILSQHRAESVMSYLREHGVTNTLTAKGFGKDDPIADNNTADGRLENRRVSLRIVGGP